MPSMFKVCSTVIFVLFVLMVFQDVTLSEEHQNPPIGKDNTVGELSEIKILHQWSPSQCDRKVKSGDFVRYHYYGMLEDGTFFDSSYERGETYNTYVGSGWLIPGMDQALIEMCLNEHRIVAIPSHLAYGDLGTDDIPGGATILFNFVLVDISNPTDGITVTTTYAPPECKRKLVDSDFVRYHYNGTLLNGAPFHSSYIQDRTYDTYVGTGWLIRGMDQGLLGSCMGERRTIIIPPHLAYGDKGDGKNIPPSATVKFDIEIMDFHNPKDDTVSETLNQKFGLGENGEDMCPRKVEETDFVRYHYNATLIDGTQFDSSYSRNSTYDTYVGFKRLIAGMEQALIGTCVGETKKIVIPPHLGYGEPGIEGRIPGSAVLVFTIYLVDVHNPKDKVKVDVLTPPPEKCNRKAELDDFLTYDYELELMDGRKLDSSKDRPGTWATYNGRGRVILGLERALTGMCIGEQRRAIIPPHLGFGEQGIDGVPGSAVLVYTIELHKIEDSLPEGMLFMWKDGKSEPDNLFELIDNDVDSQISMDEFMLYILRQVDEGNAKLLPGSEREKVVEELFGIMDQDKDDFLVKTELKVPLPPKDSLGEKMEDEL